MNKYFKISSCAVALALLATSAFAVGFDAGVKETYGARHYNGVGAFGQLNIANVSVEPMFNSFHNDFSSGTFNTYSLRLGYDTKLFGIGLTGGATPSVNGYNNKFAGADVTFSLTPTGEGARERINGRQQASGPAQGRGLARVDVGGAATYIYHTDHFGTSNQALGAAAHLAQTDVTGSVGVAVLESLLSLDMTKSVYEHQPASVLMRSPRVENVVGLANVVQGYPNTSANVKLLFGATPLLKPFAQYTHTTFEAGQPNSNAYTAGVSAELAILEVSASYERYQQQGNNQNFVSVGANVRF